MATRLYPLTQNPRKLEQLAGVPRGTYRDLKRMENRRPQKCDALAKWYSKLFRRRNLNKLHRFLSSGWGRVARYTSPAGSTTDRHETLQLLNAQGVKNVPFETCEGLCWS